MSSVQRLVATWMATSKDEELEETVTGAPSEPLFNIPTNPTVPIRNLQ
jgi:hypothetical protein